MCRCVYAVELAGLRSECSGEGCCTTPPLNNHHSRLINSFSKVSSFKGSYWPAAEIRMDNKDSCIHPMFFFHVLLWLVLCCSFQGQKEGEPLRKLGQRTQHTDRLGIAGPLTFERPLK